MFASAKKDAIINGYICSNPLVLACGQTAVAVPSRRLPNAVDWWRPLLNAAFNFLNWLAFFLIGSDLS